MTIKYYLVGGACRDILMGNTPKDYDFVVVGAKVSDFEYLEQVGKDFPVFLEPTYKWELALARTERKTGRGYNGFSCDVNNVTLEEDLSRRDLTLNSIAIEVDWETSLLLGEPVTVGTWIDPFSGRQDIKDKVLSHTTDAFAEDPVRVLRVARFLSRFGDEWEVDYYTCKLIANMFMYGALKELVPERIWLEVSKSLSGKTPSIFFEFLRSVDMFEEVESMRDTSQRLAHHPEGDVWKHCQLVMDYAAKTYNDPEITFASFTHDFGKSISHEKYSNSHGHEKEGLQPINDFCDRYKVPNRYRELALLVCENHTRIHGCMSRGSNDWMRPKSIYKLFESTSALTKPERFEKILKACIADARGRGATPEQIRAFEAKPYPQAEYLRECLQAVIALDTKAISSELLAKGKKGCMIGEQIRVARIDAIRTVTNKWKLKEK